MITIVIGQSGAGKTTFTKSELLPGPYEIEERIIPVTRAANGAYGIGRYGVGKRTEGTDTLPYNAQERVLKAVEELSAEGRDVVMEGDRINNRQVLSRVLALGYPVKLYLVTCSLGTSMRRLRAAGSTITVPFVKATKTKSRRIYVEFAEQCDGEIITTEGEDK